MSEISSLSTTDASNTARFSEGQNPSTVNDGARALEGMIARWSKDIDGSLVSTGSSNAYALASNRTLTSYAQNQAFIFEANFANTGAATLNVDSIGAKAIKKHNDVALASGDIESGQIVMVVYEASADAFQMISQLGNAPSAGISNVVEDTTPQLGGDLDLNGNNIDFPTTANISDCLDEDDMSSDSATALATQQSIKAYTDAAVSGLATITAGTTLTQNPIAGNATVTQAHGLGAEPSYLKIVLECIDTDVGYSIGDRIIWSPQSRTGTAVTGWTVNVDATNVELISVSSGLTINVQNKSTRASGNITLTKWKVEIVPYLFG